MASAPEPCIAAEALLAARAAGSISPAGEAELLGHLDSCPDCRRLARALESPALYEALDVGGAVGGDLQDFAPVSPDRYERGREIGRGGMGRVILARDRRLGRAVAIKELLDARLHARFEREARLTARLQHPAIVSVHEAGRWPGGEPFYAMKYVAGRPLHQLIAETATLAERLALLPSFTTVAEAIAYAHSERVIHRDLKPHNILVGAFGETVVIDWGLATDLTEPADADAPRDAEAGPLTLAGAGTPAYMAPEQARGEAPDEGVDIYALGATLHHILAGEPPGQADIPAEAPAELRAIADRAMAPERIARYRSAAELVDELRRFQTGQLVRAHHYSFRALAVRWARRHRSGLLSVAAVVAAAALFVAARKTVAPAPSCGDGRERLAGAWDASVRSAVEKRFLATRRPYAADTSRRVAAALDGYAAGWSALRKETCEATAVRHEQSEALLDVRMQCLDRRLGELRALTALFARTPDAELVDHAVTAVGKLDDVVSCADRDVLTAAPLPTEPGARIEIASLRGLLEEAHALRLGGKYQPALALVRPVSAEAERLGYAPLELEATIERSTIERYLGERGREDRIHRWLALAARLGNDQEIARGWLELMFALTSSDRGADAIGLARTSEVAVARAGDPAPLRARLAAEIGRAHELRGELDAAQSSLREAVALIERSPERDDVELASALNALGSILWRAGEYVEARASFQRAIDVAVARLGPDHIDVAGAFLNLANLLSDEGRYDDASTLYQRAAERFEGALGADGWPVGLALTNLGNSERARGRYQDAASHLERAVAIYEKALGPTHRRLAVALEDLGVALAYLGRTADADRAVERARAITEASAGVEHPSYGRVVTDLALLAQLRGQCREAAELARRAQRILEKALGKDHPDLAGPLLILGQCQIDLGAPREASAVLERALAIRGARGGDPADTAELEFALGRARFALDRQDRSAPELVINARLEFSLLGPVQKARARDADRWLADRRAK